MIEIDGIGKKFIFYIKSSVCCITMVSKLRSQPKPFMSWVQSSSSDSTTTAEFSKKKRKEKKKQKLKQKNNKKQKIDLAWNRNAFLTQSQLLGSYR